MPADPILRLPANPAPAPTAALDPLLTDKRGAAKLLCVSIATLDRIPRDELPRVTINGYMVRFRLIDLRRYVERLAGQ